MGLFQGICTVALAGAELPLGSILNLDKDLLIQMAVQAVNVLLLTAVLAFLLYKPVKQFMAQRKERIAAEIEAAQKDRAEALELKEQYERMIADIETEREEILHAAYKKAMERSDQMLFAARREAENIYQRALSELEIEKENVADEMKRQIIEIAALMAGRFVEVSIDRETQDRLIAEALAEWEES
jgi:F-type H+-transporting ATPase subunit b